MSRSSTTRSRTSNSTQKMSKRNDFQKKKRKILYIPSEMK